MKYNKLILHLKDDFNLPLMTGKVDKIDIYYDYEKPYVDESLKTYFSNGEEVELEITPNEDKNTYYLPLCLLDEKESLEKIYSSKKLRIVLTIDVKNSFGVVSKAEYTIHLMKDDTAKDNWVKYRMDGRKIYFKEIVYDGDFVEQGWY